MMRIPLSLVAASMAQAKIVAHPDAWITGLCADSRELQRGDLFACIRGAHMDATRFIPEAIRKGAAALLVDVEVSEKKAAGLGVVRVPDVVAALSGLAPVFYGLPATSFRLVGVTGTSGKTTVTYLLRNVLRAGEPKRGVGLMGTIQHEFPGHSLPAHNTTPPVWEVQRLLHLMRESRCANVVMEVSSHALVQNRVAGCEFDAAVFTNLSREHLDFHGSMSEYARAKQRLFRLLAQPGVKSGPKVAAINLDDPHATAMMRAAKGTRVLTYGFAKRADIRAEKLEMGAERSRFLLCTPAGKTDVSLPLVGAYNVSNALAAAAVGIGFGLSLAAVRSGLQTVQSVPGRMEKIVGAKSFAVLVDFAHKPDALEKALNNVRAWTRGRVWVVFGCGGERDHGKRPIMGAIASRLADQVVLTTDNARSEDPMTILKEIKAGCPANAPVHVEADRKKAIRWALEQAQRGDTVLLAGKGHETYQIIGDRVSSFDDRKVAQHILKALKIKARKERA